MTEIPQDFPEQEGGFLSKLRPSRLVGVSWRIGLAAGTLTGLIGGVQAGAEVGAGVALMIAGVRLAVPSFENAEKILKEGLGGGRALKEALNSCFTSLLKSSPLLGVGGAVAGHGLGGPEGAFAFGMSALFLSSGVIYISAVNYVISR